MVRPLRSDTRNAAPCTEMTQLWCSHNRVLAGLGGHRSQNQTHVVIRPPTCAPCRCILHAIPGPPREAAASRRPPEGRVCVARGTRGAALLSGHAAAVMGHRGASPRDHPSPSIAFCSMRAAVRSWATGASHGVCRSHPQPDPPVHDSCICPGHSHERAISHTCPEQWAKPHKPL